MSTPTNWVVGNILENTHSLWISPSFSLQVKCSSTACWNTLLPFTDATPYPRNLLECVRIAKDNNESKEPSYWKLGPQSVCLKYQLCVLHLKIVSWLSYLVNLHMTEGTAYLKYGSCTSPASVLANDYCFNNCDFFQSSCATVYNSACMAVCM